MAVELLAAADTADEEGRMRIASSSTVKDTVGPETASVSGMSLTTFFSVMICRSLHDFAICRVRKARPCYDLFAVWSRFSSECNDDHDDCNFIKPATNSSD